MREVPTQPPCKPNGEDLDPIQLSHCVADDSRGGDRSSRSGHVVAHHTDRGVGLRGTCENTAASTYQDVQRTIHVFSTPAMSPANTPIGSLK